jgi:hypothetical protein
MMRKCLLLIIFVTLIIFAGCSEKPGSTADEAASKYLIALAEKNKSEVVALSCKEWEESATLEVDALLSVDAEVSDLKCAIVEENSSEAKVVCEGSLDLTYNDEIRAIDLSRRTYDLRYEDGLWRICSYK